MFSNFKTSNIKQEESSILDDKKSSDKKSGDYNSVDTLIGRGASITGNVNTEGNIRIDGVFTGDVISSKRVLIGETGVMTGCIVADSIVIYGKVNGDIKSQGLLEIMPTGKLYGDIEVKSVSIKEGAVFSGNSVMGDIDVEDIGKSQDKKDSDDEVAVSKDV
jgi:cytoskeletal protein CcmA (bactofilin family)